MDLGVIVTHRVSMLYSLEWKSALKNNIGCKEYIVNLGGVKAIREGSYIPCPKTGVLRISPHLGKINFL
jgi:hypothetical protein